VLCARINGLATTIAPGRVWYLCERKAGKTRAVRIITLYYVPWVRECVFQLASLVFDEGHVMHESSRENRGSGTA
jgi:hypothetical protein